MRKVKKIIYSLLILLVLFSVGSFYSSSKAQKTGFQKTDQKKNDTQKPADIKVAAPGQSVTPSVQALANIPPALWIEGREKDIDRVFVETATVGKEIKLVIYAVDPNPNGVLLPLKEYGLPASAKFDPKTYNIEKYKSASYFSWTPAKEDIGIHGFAFEVVNDKGLINRLAFFYNIKE